MRHPHFDIHWSPQASICDPCSVDFRYFVKLETFDADVAELLREVTTEVIRVVPHERKSGKSQSIKRMLMKVNPAHLRRYLQIFKADFDLFGYDYDKFNSLAQEIINTKQRKKRKK